MNKNFNYYYVSFTFFNSDKYYYLSRRNIRLYLNNFGSIYNITPSILDDDYTDFMVFNFALKKEYSIESVLEDLKKSDNVIKSYFFVESNNLFNIKYIFSRKANKEDMNLISKNHEYVDIKFFDNSIDSYLYFEDAKEESLKAYSKDLLIVSKKTVDNKHIKLYLPNGIDKKNIKKIKQEIENIYYDKIIESIAYNSADYLGLQFLTYLQTKYNIQLRKGENDKTRRIHP